MTAWQLIALFIKLLFGHAVMDFPMQGDFMSRAKNHTHPLQGVPYGWPLFFHALMHGVTVAYFTHSMILGWLEAGVHVVLDYRKCEGSITFHEDQQLHVLCKVMWVGLVYSAYLSGVTLQ